MKLVKTGLLFTATLLILSAAGWTQTDHFGVPDTMYAEITKINDQNWSVTVTYVNDEDIVGLSVPLKMNAGATKIVADSALYTGGRVEHFAYKGFRPDTAIQCVMLGMMANLGPTDNVLAPGRGRLVTIFISSLEDDKPIEKLTVDTTTLSPNNSLMTVVDRKELEALGDTIPPHLDKRIEVYPVFVSRYSE